MKDNVALIVAGGKGKRMGAKVSKQFIEIQEKPVLYYTLLRFEKCKNINSIVLVLPKEEIEFSRKNIIEKYDFKKVKRIVSGGKERQDSVYNGLIAIEHCNVVLIHDGARPFVEDRIIEEGIEWAEKYDAAACGVRPKDTIKVIDSCGFSSNTLNREELFCVQTPQCFKYETILKAHEYIKDNCLNVTDDTRAVELIGYKVFLYEGSYKNIKITTPEDLVFAKNIMTGI
ncbi:2-C-methyl-D-erythritol 4-phosphate cytidylyltransferase [Desnuesiella massiliensis]|uniref:2-C-methyl-D-erythritol 4-phosphate cytidylyltransferase n=1 Tax=Desnuesiella massiliensis TaxID=1650662 RepID=UPI0006E300BA|nr:2-C-methyl-D-erythritol 4-phosphate cytidylyltransferase [Desnuesiella massiliensis]